MSNISLQGDSTASLPRLRIGIIVVMASLLMAAIISWAGLIVIEQPLVVSQVGPGAGGHEWADYHVDSPLRTSGFFVIPCDDNAGDTRGALNSELQFFEDDKLQGPNHSVDEIIGEIGAGAYSYRCLDSGAVRGLVFSTSDNSDPRINGHHYRVRFPIKMAPTLFIGTLSLVAILALVALRRQWLSWWIGSLWLATILTISLAFVGWFSEMPAAFFMPDSWSYLHPAVSAFAGGPLLVSGSRSIVYPLFVLAVLNIFGSIASIVYVQLVLYIITAVLVATIPWATTIGKRLSPASRIFSTYLSIGSLLLFFHYAPMTYSIHAIMPEMLYTTLSTVTLLLLIISFRISSRLWISIGCGFGAYLTVANFYVKPSWGIAMLFSGCLFAFRVLLDRSIKMISKASVLAISGFLILATMIIPNNYLSDTYDNYLHKTFGPLTLICHHEPLIIRSIDQHLHDVNAIDHRMLERVKNNMAVIVSQGPGPDHYSVLGYDPNLCLSGNVKNPIEEAYSHDPNRIAYLMTQIFLRAVRDDPLDYLAKVVRHMMAMLQQPLVEINVTTHFNDTSVPSATIIESVVGARLFADHSRFEGITRAPLTSDFGYAILNGINKTLWAMMLLGSILFILDIVWPGNGIKAVVLRWTPAMLASGLLICATLVVAISSTADVTRYRHPLCPLVLGTVVILLQVFVEMFRSNISCIGARQT